MGAQAYQTQSTTLSSSTWWLRISLEQLVCRLWANFTCRNLIVDLWFLGHLFMVKWMLDGVCIKVLSVFDILTFIIRLQSWLRKGAFAHLRRCCSKLAILVWQWCAFFMEVLEVSHDQDFYCRSLVHVTITIFILHFSYRKWPGHRRAHFLCAHPRLESTRIYFEGRGSNDLVLYRPRYCNPLLLPQERAILWRSGVL